MACAGSSRTLGVVSGSPLVLLAHAGPICAILNPLLGLLSLLHRLACRTSTTAPLFRTLSAATSASSNLVGRLRRGVAGAGPICASLNVLGPWSPIHALANLRLNSTLCYLGTSRTLAEVSSHPLALESHAVPICTILHALLGLCPRCLCFGCEIASPASLSSAFQLASPCQIRPAWTNAPVPPRATSTERVCCET